MPRILRKELKEPGIQDSVWLDLGIHPLSQRFVFKFLDCEARARLLPVPSAVQRRIATAAATLNAWPPTAFLSIAWSRATEEEHCQQHRPESVRTEDN